MYIVLVEIYYDDLGHELDKAHAEYDSKAIALAMIATS